MVDKEDAYILIKNDYYIFSKFQVYFNSNASYLIYLPRYQNVSPMFSNLNITTICFTNAIILSIRFSPTKLVSTLL